MYFSLRTTVFWNIVILMVVAIALTVLVLVHVTEREILQQRISAGTELFAVVRASLPAALLQTPELFEQPLPESEINALFAGLVRDGLCSDAVLVNQRNQIVARSDSRRRIGAVLADRDLHQASLAGRVVATIHADDTGAESRLYVAGPVSLQGTPAGMLKLVFPLRDAHNRAAAASRLIILYGGMNALLLVAVGFFLLSRYVVTPLAKLTRLTENIAAGDLGGLPLFFSEKNEIGKLSTALRDMTEKLVRERDTIQAQMRALAEKTAQLEQAHRELLQSEKLASVGRLAAGIAHEIGNPVGIILGFLHMLRDGTADERTRTDYLARIQRETERVHEIVSDLLEFAQPADQRPQPCDLNGLIGDVCALIAGQKDFSRVVFSCDLAGDLPPVLAHERLMRQMIMNLVLNARDAMPDGGTVTLRTRAPEGPGGSVTLTVADTGTGIPPEHQDKIFDPFFTTKKQGTGLGLANVHRIVALAGGTVGVTSTPGRGATFTITLPAIRGEARDRSQLSEDRGSGGTQESGAPERRPASGAAQQ